MEFVRQVILRDYSGVIMDELSPLGNKGSSRKILEGARSLGLVIKLLTPGAVYTEAHNAFIASLPAHVRAIVFAVKRFYREEWGDDWFRHFSVDSVRQAADGG